MAEIKPDIETFARIKVVGVGGSGGNAISRMVEEKVQGVEFVAINTDAQALHNCRAAEKIHIGKNLTKGLGAGMNPEVGRQAAEENRDEIQEVLKGADMVFITCGLGGGTGSGAAPIVAEVAKESGALTVAVVTKPFMFEGMQRRRIGEEAMELLRERVDTLIAIPNDKLLNIIDRKTTLINAFRIVDDVLRQGVQGISDLITKPGIVNVDFADVRAVMADSGSALMGIGVSAGENRAAEAARAAINSPLLELSIDGARGVLFNVSGGNDLTMLEVSEAANIITESIDPDARVIFGAVIDDQVRKGEIRITVVATGFDNRQNLSTEQKLTRAALNTLRDRDVQPVTVTTTAVYEEEDVITPSETVPMEEHHVAQRSYTEVTYAPQTQSVMSPGEQRIQHEEVSVTQFADNAPNNHDVVQPSALDMIYNRQQVTAQAQQVMQQAATTPQNHVQNHAMTFPRRRKSLEPEIILDERIEEPQVIKNDIAIDDEFEIPAFIRRKLKK